MSILEHIKKNSRLKTVVIHLMTPKNQARPRLWVKLFLNPFKHKRGKGSTIRKRTRIDVFPWNNFKIGSDSTIEDFSTMNNGSGSLVIGDRTRIGLGSVIIGPVTIGNDVRLAQHVILSGLNHGYEDIGIPPSKQKVTTSEIIIEDDVWIGANAVIVAGVLIGKHAVVAAGSVVTKNVPPFSVAAGNPARIIKQYNFNKNFWEKISDGKTSGE